MTTLDSILDTEIAEIPLFDLGLDDEISHGLVDSGYHKVGDVYALQAEGISLVLGIDYSQAQDFWVKALALIANPDNWTYRVSDRPTDIQTKIMSPNLTEILPEWIKSFFASLNRTRDYTVLYRRYGLNGNNQVTLEEVGIFLDLTRERIRQIQNNAISRLRKQIDSNNEKLFKSEVEQEILTLKQALESDGGPARLEEDLFQFITTRYGTALSPSLEQHYRLLFVVFGWEDVSQYGNSNFDVKPFWILNTDKLAKLRILEVGQRIFRFLQENCIKTDYFSIKVHLNSKRQKLFTDLEIRTAIKVSPNIEQVEDDTFQLAFHCLKSAPDMAFRVLSEVGEPLSAVEIHRRVSQRLSLSGEKILSRYTISNSMVDDPRIVAIGKSQWALRDWEDVILGTIIDHMRNFFYQHNKPAKAKEIYEFVKKRRPVNRNSINTYLVDRDEFVRVGRGLYQLAEWGSPKLLVDDVDDEQRWPKERVAEAVISAFESYGKDVMPASELVRQLNTMGLGASNIYQRLRSCPAVGLKVISERPRRLEASVIKNYSFERPLTLRETLQEIVRDILTKQPDKSIPLFDLRNQITKRTNVSPYTFYGYLSDMIEIQKDVVPGTRTVIVTLVGDNTQDDQGTVSDVWDNEFTYDIAVSYAGAERVFAADMTEEFRANNLKVFYDRNQLPDLVGRNLLDELMTIYRDKAKLCVILASEAYNKSQIAQHERQSAQDREFTDSGYIVLVNLDNCKIKGFLSTVAYLDWREYGLKKIASIAMEQLRKRSESIR